MPRKLRVLTSSFSLGRGRTIARNREQACAYVDAAAQERADLVCLAENFLHTGVPHELVPAAEPLPGPTFDALAEAARRASTWVVGSTCTRDEDGLVRNTAFVIDRRGRLAGRYAKVHPTIGECEDRHITPGADATVIETDFGRLGLAICYDIGWPDHWAALAHRGAEVVVWPSAYDGGFPLQAYAWSHLYYVVSAVATEHSRIIDISGSVLASTSRWHRLASATIDLEKELFHIDGQTDKLLRIQQERGAGVTAQAFSSENVFTLESHDPEWPMARLKAAYALENFRDYHARASGVQDRHREPAAPTRGRATAGAAVG